MSIMTPTLFKSIHDKAALQFKTAVAAFEGTDFFPNNTIANIFLVEDQIEIEPVMLKTIENWESNNISRTKIATATGLAGVVNGLSAHISRPNVQAEFFLNSEYLNDISKFLEVLTDDGLGDVSYWFVELWYAVKNQRISNDFVNADHDVTEVTVTP